MLNRSHGQLCAECYCVPEDVTPRQDPDLRDMKLRNRENKKEAAQTWARGRSVAI